MEPSLMLVTAAISLTLISSRLKSVMQVRSPSLSCAMARWQSPLVVHSKIRTNLPSSKLQFGQRETEVCSPANSCFPLFKFIHLPFLQDFSQA
jgi:hypothetical protein